MFVKQTNFFRVIKAQKTLWPYLTLPDRKVLSLLCSWLETRSAGDPAAKSVTFPNRTVHSATLRQWVGLFTDLPLSTNNNDHPPRWRHPDTANTYSSGWRHRKNPMLASHPGPAHCGPRACGHRLHVLPTQHTLTLGPPVTSVLWVVNPLNTGLSSSDCEGGWRLRVADTYSVKTLPSFLTEYLVQRFAFC